MQTSPTQYRICQPHFLEPQTICSGQPYQKLCLDRGGRETNSLFVIDSSHNVIMNTNDGRFNTMARSIGWLIYFSYVVIENMIVILAKTAHSINFDKDAKLLFGLKFSKHSGSSPSFFSSGFSKASLRVSGNNPNDNDALIMLLMIDRRVPLHCFKSHIGIGSRSQWVVSLEIINLSISVSESGTKTGLGMCLGM